MKMSKYIDEIDRYFSGLMDELEKVEFENALKRNAELRRAVTMYKEINFTIKNQKALELVDLVMQDLNSIQHEKNMNIRRIYRNKGLQIAAMLIILIGIGIVIVLLTRKPPETSNTIAEYFAPQKIHFNFRSTEGGRDVLLKEGIDLFNNKKYSEASRFFLKIYSNDTTDHQAAYYWGLSELYSGNIEKAKEVLNYINSTGDVNYSNEARWYLAWCYIQQDSVESAKEHLIFLHKDQYFGEKAGNVLRLLNGK